MSGVRSGLIWQLKKLYWGRKTYWGIPSAWRRLKYRKFRRPGLIIERNSYRYKIHDHDDLVSESLYVHGTCARYVTALLQSAKSSFKTFIDVGANIGSVTVPIAKGFKGKVLSVEPSNASYALLTENIALNALDDGQVECRKVAIGDQPGQLPLYHSATNTGDHRLSAAPNEGDRESEMVDVVTLDSLVIGKSDYKPPFLIKIDVQGYEAKVLASATALLNQPCLVIAEFWPYGLRVAGSPISEFAALVAQHHLTVYEISEERVALRRADIDEVNGALSDQRFDESRDLVLTNMPLHLTGLSNYLSSSPT